MRTTYLVTALLLLNLACQTKPKKDETNVAQTAQVDSAIALAKRPTAEAPRSAADRLVRALYFEHNKKDNPFREKNRALIDEYFAPSTADLIWKNSAKLKSTKNNPLFNAPDTAIRKTWVEPAAMGGSRAIVYVTFENSGKPEEVKVDLQQQKGRWYIVDMLYPTGKQLTKLLQ
jgi:murein L,D-transpeptidase YcbB/YkuD